MIADAERRFPVRVRIAVPAGGFGRRLEAMYAWLDQNCGADGWKITPAGLRGVLNDAVAIYFQDAALAAGFVARGVVNGRRRLKRARSWSATMIPFDRVPRRRTGRRSEER